MRGDPEQQAPMWSYLSPEQRVPQDHPLRPIRTLVDAVLKDLSPRFSQLYAKTGRPSVAPERLLRALLLQVLYSIRSERMLMEQLDWRSSASSTICSPDRTRRPGFTRPSSCCNSRRRHSAA
jgi:transposase-like protein DUF772